jgi:hypothetical protein
MNLDFSNQLFPGILTIIIPVAMLAAVFIYSRQQRQKVRREWEQTKQQDPNLRDWARMEEEIKPSRQWYGLPVGLLVAGWTISIGAMSYLTSATALGIAVASALVAIIIAAIISRRRAQARRLLMNTPAYQQYGHQHPGLSWFIRMFVIASVIGMVSGFLRSEGGIRWIKAKFGTPAEESSGAKRSSDPVDLTTTKARLPADFPADIPVYPGATVEFVPSSGAGLSVTLTAPDAMFRVAMYYKEELKKNGWRIDDKQSREDRVEATKGKRRCTVRLLETGGMRTRITINT